MRPVKLIMSAFCSYKDRQEIDFSKLGGNGIYLIAGDTGAGKTTIFDAICYALYGSPSGETRSDKMLRSNYAGIEDETFVDLEFEHRGRNYRIKRSPGGHKKQKKNGTYTKEQDGYVNFSFTDHGEEKTISEKEKIKTKINEMLGMDERQFRQIVMLAQGNFQKLLLSETKERQKILREIFGTGIYAEFQEKIKEKIKTIKDQFNLSFEKAKGYVNDINCDDKYEELSKEAKEAREKINLSADIPGLIMQIIARDKKEAEAAEHSSNDLQARLEKKNDEIGKLKNLIETKKKYNSAKQKLNQENILFEEAKKSLENAVSNKPEIKNLDKQANAIEHDMQKYGEMQNLLERLSVKQGEIEQNNHSFDKKEKNLKELEVRLENLKKEQDFLSDSEAKVILNENKKKEIEEKQRNIENLRKDILGLEKIKINSENLNKELFLLEKTFRQKDNEAQTLRQAFFAGYAGILSEMLEDGQPCPVCGSSEHPKKAVKAGNVPDEKTVSRAEKESKDLYEKVSSKRDAFAKIQAELIAAKNEAEKKIREFIGSFSIEVASKEAEKRKDVLDKQLLDVEASIKNEKKRLARMKELKVLIPNSENEKKAMEAEISLLKQVIAALNADIENIIRQADEIKKGLKYPDKSSAEKAMDCIRKKKNKIEKEIETAQKKHDAIKEEINRLEGQIEENQRDFSGNEEKELQKAAKQKAELQKGVNTAIELRSFINGRILQNEKTLKNVKSEFAHAQELHEKYAWAEALSKTANGDVNGQSKITLETYALMSYFDMALAKANVNMLQMTYGKLELKRSDAASSNAKSGLDLSVIDHYNGTERSVNSLSGGETFMASLSLALGLSEVIQEYAGGIQTDTLFVDEGFGSLDDSALENAKRILMELAKGNRLVGIISHVSALKHSIEHKIIVSKDRFGSSIAKVEA